MEKIEEKHDQAWIDDIYNQMIIISGNSLLTCKLIEMVNRLKCKSQEAIKVDLEQGIVDEFKEINNSKAMETNNALFEKDWANYEKVKATHFFQDKQANFLFDMGSVIQGKVNSCYLLGSLLSIS